VNPLDTLANVELLHQPRGSEKYITFGCRVTYKPASFSSMAMNIQALGDAGYYFDI
jgi:hypothetical protein